MAEVIRYVLFKTQQNGGCPIKREELTQLIAKNYRQRALPTIIIKEARDKLSSIFGYEMRELQRARPSSANQGHASQQSMIYYNMCSYIHMLCIFFFYSFFLYSFLKLYPGTYGCHS